MKKPKPFLATLLFSLILLYSCSKERTGLVTPTSEVLIKNIWAVDYFFYNQDMTTEFSSSRILFSSTGAVGLQKNGETIPGTWNITVDGSKNEVVHLQFNTTSAGISKLNQSWKLVDHVTNVLKFEENSGS